MTRNEKLTGPQTIDFDREGSTLILYEYISRADAQVYAVKDKRLASFEVFEANKQRYVEPNEAIEVQQFILIPDQPKLAYRLEADIFSTSVFTWRAMSIVDKTSLGDNVDGLIGL